MWNCRTDKPNCWAYSTKFYLFILHIDSFWILSQDMERPFYRIGQAAAYFGCNIDDLRVVEFYRVVRILLSSDFFADVRVSFYHE